MITNLEYINQIESTRKAILKDGVGEDEKKGYLIYLEKLLPKPTKILYIDADGLIYKAAYSPIITNVVEPIEGGTFIGIGVEADNDLETMFNSIVERTVEACKYESLMGNMITFKDYVLVYTPSTNFRYEVYDKYKYRRFDKPQSEELIELKSIVKPKGLIVEGVEADDVVAYYGRHGNPIASGDKDVIFGVPGNNYMYHKDHLQPYHVTQEDADRFVLLQSIAGDYADDIPGIAGVGMKTKLLPTTFKEVIDIYTSHAICNTCKDLPKVKAIKIETIQGAEIPIYNVGKPFYGICKKCECERVFTPYNKEDAITTRRLVGMDQWAGPRRGLKLFNYET